MKKWFAVMLFLSLAIFGSVIGFNMFKQHKIAEYMANLPEPEFPVTATTVKAIEWTPSIEVIGFIEPNQGVVISNESSGIITDILFESGAIVKQNQLLVLLDAGVQKANLDSASVTLPAAKAKYERYQGLIETGAISKEAFDETQASYFSLKGNIESLKAQIALREIKAPFAGNVGIRNVFLGQFLDVGSDIVRLEDNSIMRFRFTVPQTDLSKLKKGQQLNIFVDAYPQKAFDGKITAIEPAVNYQSGLVQVQASIPNRDRELRSGMFARAYVILPSLADQVVLPQTSVTYALYGSTVFIMNKDDKGNLRVTQTVVTEGKRQNDMVHILSGVKPGDVVVTSGQVRLSNGVKVKEVQNDALNTPAITPQL